MKLKYALFCLIIIVQNNIYGQAKEVPKSDFKSLCKIAKPKSNACEEIHDKFFSKLGDADSSIFKPADVNAPSTPLDSKIQFMILKDPNLSVGIGYCYFIFRGWITTEAMNPDSFGTNVPGFSILNEELDQYKQWLLTANGKACKSFAEKEAEVPVVDLKETLKGYVALIVLNPYASLQVDNPTTELVLKDMTLTVNHERIHAFQVMCPNFEKWSIAEWAKLPKNKKQEFINKYSSYNWNDPKVAGREFIAYVYENMPNQIDSHIKGCKLK